MKKGMLLTLGACAAAITMTGCAGVAVGQGGVASIAAGPNFYSDVNANALIQPVVKYDKIVKKNVTSSAVLRSYFTCVNIGDVSYETLKKAALKNVEGANDLVEVKVDYDMQCICGINTITAKLTATAVDRK